MANPKYDRTLVIKIDAAIDQYLDQAANARGLSRAGVVRSALLSEKRRAAGGWEDVIITRKI